MSGLFWLTDAQMSRLEPFFPKSHALSCRRFAMQICREGQALGR